jgi:hypothetical protein
LDTKIFNQINCLLVPQSQLRSPRLILIAAAAIFAARPTPPPAANYFDKWAFSSIFKRYYLLVTHASSCFNQLFRKHQ